ncbi:uncharacterized protein K444DRAFT_131084 [Hyaloscypha bicolor E]|uniref:Clr5 domain-containing protein n=1 Tax=Hyaloscypha bicolor E TaxID=1095630 RepID=A0A2J6SSU8_9HELO|nr:uncharacterized protein K444DRAFT_131084 [Hyaloscypha bicolor E]PMD53854.1 hypothetical protein K444DRAFT_131084 [Hyaloscypha bicolor E]
MDDNFLESIWAPTGPASSHDILDEQEDASSTMIPGLGKKTETNARRKMYPKEQWLALKPLIYRLYITENQTFTKVAQHLQEHHRFNPTKKQFLRRAKEWGFEKNVKKEERRAILETVDGEGQLEERMLRGRRLDKAKLERWRKREGIVGGGSQNGPADTSKMGEETSSINEDGQSVPPKMDICNDDGTVEEIPRCGNQLRSIPMNLGQTFDPWLAVDVVGSPRLTGLIGALTLELCGGFADLDLSAPYSGEDEDKCDLLDTDEGDGIAVSCTTRAPQTSPTTTRPGFSFHIPALSTQFSTGCHPRMLGPLDELCPFPKVGQRRRLSRHPRSDHLVDEFSLEVEELRCRMKLKELNNMTPSRIADLVESMRSVAQRHYELDHYRLAESWWRRVITCSLAIPGYQPAKLLYACLWVVENLLCQGRVFKALSLHRDLHQKITKLVGPEHELAIFSKSLLANLHNNIGENQSDLVISREILQTCLLRYGVRDILTVGTMVSLGQVLIVVGQLKEADAILRTLVELECEILANAERDVIETQRALDGMTALAWSLRAQGRFDDSGNVLHLAEGQFAHTLLIEKLWCWHFYVETVHVLRAKGQLLESEEMIRAILRQAPSHPDWEIMNSMELLADLLRQTGRRTEEAKWRQNIFLMGIELYGIDNRYSRWDCEDLGFCYADLGRYDDAVHHFQQTIEKLALRQDGDSDDRASYIKKIREWICLVEERRKEDEGWETQSSLDEGWETQSILDEDAHENLTDVPLAVDFS